MEEKLRGLLEMIVLTRDGRFTMGHGAVLDKFLGVSMYCVLRHISVLNP